MISKWFRDLVSRHPPLCQSCSNRDIEIAFKAVPGDEYGFGTRPALMSVCKDGVTGFPYHRSCKNYKHILPQAKGEQGAPNEI